MRFWDWQADARRTTRWLLLLFAGCVLVSLAAVHGGLTLAWWLLFSHAGMDYPKGFVLTNVGVTLLLILGGWWLTREELSQGARNWRSALVPAGAPTQGQAEQQLCNIVQEMCVAAQMQPPQVVVLARTDAINAFAAGWTQDDAIVAVTQGALDYLTRDEMQGLVAHELSHLKEGDTLLNMQLAGMVSGLGWFTTLVTRCASAVAWPGGLVLWSWRQALLGGAVGVCSKQQSRASVNTWPMRARCNGRAAVMHWAACCAK